MSRTITDRDALISELNVWSQVFMVYDEAVEAYADGIADEAGIGASLGINVSPEGKTMDAVLEICSFLLTNGADRGSLLLCVGGGTLTDIAGMAASIYMRGVACAYVPTTLLSQVDASMGGKTGVNFMSFKNMLGTFSEPEFIFRSMEPLSSLPRREMVSGFAELLKTFIISDAGLYERAVETLPGVTAGNLAALDPLIAEAARIKEEIVAKDPREGGLRRSLNLGHTFGHAIEWYEQTHTVEQVHTHGEAVAIGMVAAARLSEERGICEKGLAERLARDFKACGLPVDMPCSPECLEEALRADKKSSDGHVRFVLPERLGKVLIQ